MQGQVAETTVPNRADLIQAVAVHSPANPIRAAIDRNQGSPILAVTVLNQVNRILVAIVRSRANLTPAVTAQIRVAQIQAVLSPVVPVMVVRRSGDTVRQGVRPIASGPPIAPIYTATI